MSILTIGDSFTAQAPWKVWPTLLGEHLGMPVENRAVPGSGFIATGIWAGRNRFSRQLLTAQTTDPKLVVFFGSVNDQAADNRELCTTAWATLHAAKKRYPAAKHLWIGPQWSGPDTIPSNVIAARDAVLQAVWGLDFDCWMDPLDQQWFPRDRPELWDTDKFHPNGLGQQRIESLIYTQAAKIVLGR